MIQELGKTIPEDVRDDLLDRENVVGVGRGRKRVDGRLTDREVVVTFVRKKVPEDQLDEAALVPETLEVEDQDVETDVQESGEFYAQALEQMPAPMGQTGEQQAGEQQVESWHGEDRKDKWRPKVPAGVSGGHPEITAGTIGSPPLFTQGDQKAFLTNAHVAAPAGKADVGDAFLQPGKYDGGVDPQDKIGELLEWGELSEEEVNTTDSALVTIDDGIVENDILGVGDLRGWTQASYDNHHVKSGRTTATTSSRLVAQDVTALVNYGSPFTQPLRFEGLDAFEAFSLGGDSGSLIGVQRQNGFHGTDLLFAGSTLQTLAVPINAVQEEHGQLRPMGKRRRRRGQQVPQAPSQTQPGAPQGESGVPLQNQQGSPLQLQPPQAGGTQQPMQAAAPEAAETQAEAQATYTALTGYLNGNQTVYRWHGGWHPGYSVHYAVRPTTNSRAVSGSVYYTWRDANGQLWYLLQIQNRSSSSTYYDVRATYEYA